MSEGIIIAIIGSAGVVLAAIIGGIFAVINRNKDTESTTRLKLIQKGNNNFQIGQQRNDTNGDKKNDWKHF